MNDNRNVLSKTRDHKHEIKSWRKLKDEFKEKVFLGENDVTNLILKKKDWVVLTVRNPGIE